MNKLILFFSLILGFSYFASAQVAYENDTIFVYGDVNAFEVDLKMRITNNSTDTAFEFTRISDANCAFTSAVCDQQLCYPEGTDKADVTMQENESFEMKVNFYPNGSGGSCGVLIYMTSKQNPANYDSCYYKLVTFDPTSSINDLSKARVSLSPNPSNNTLNIKTPIQGLFNATITDRLGRTIQTFTDISSGINIDISDLSSDVYYINIEGAGSAKFIKL